MPSIPAAMNLGDPLTAVPSIYGREPVEGRKSVTSVVEWSKPLAKGLRAININLQDNATLSYSQVGGMIVDNSDCGCDIDFIFPDTNVVISIPAYAPYTVLGVETRQVQFFVVANGAIPGDITRFSILNFTPAPVSVPVTRQQLIAATGNQTLTGVGSTAIIPATVNGTLENFNLIVAGPQPSVNFNDLLSLVDGTGKILWQGNVAAQTTASEVALNVALSGLSVRFQQGINFVQTGGFAPGATWSVTLFYKTP